MLTKTFPLQDAGFEKVAAGDDTLALINQFALQPLSPDEVYVRRMVVANDALDRDNERFSPEVLEHFARTLPGKSFLVGHQHGSAPVGRFFHAAVLSTSRSSTATLPQLRVPQSPPAVESSPPTPNPQPSTPNSQLNLVASFYTIKTKDNEGFRQQIDGGVYSSVSVGFRCERLVCDICGKDMKSTLCPHYPGKAYPPNGAAPATGTWKGQAEALEASLVYLGAQFGAQFVKTPTASHPGLESKSQRVQESDPGTPRLPDPQTLRLSDSPWDWDWKTDADAIIESLGWHGLELASAYKDPEADPETKAAYKLPHHKLVYGGPVIASDASAVALAKAEAWQSPVPTSRGASRDPDSQREVGTGGGDGHLTLFYRGVVTAMGALLGARGGADIPEANREAVYDHLAAHYRQFDEEPPELKSRVESQESQSPEPQDPALKTPNPHTDLKPETLNSKLAALEVLLEAKDRRLDQLSELAQEAKTLRSDLVSQILSKAQLIGLPSLFDPESLPDLPLPRLKSLLSDLNREFDRKFPPQGVTTGHGLQATGSGHPDSRPSTLDSKTDLSPFRLP